MRPKLRPTDKTVGGSWRREVAAKLSPRLGAGWGPQAGAGSAVRAGLGAVRGVRAAAPRPSRLCECAARVAVSGRGVSLSVPERAGGCPAGAGLMLQVRGAAGRGAARCEACCPCRRFSLGACAPERQSGIKGVCTSCGLIGGGHAPACASDQARGAPAPSQPYRATDHRPPLRHGDSARRQPCFIASDRARRGPRVQLTLRASVHYRHSPILHRTRCAARSAARPGTGSCEPPTLCWAGICWLAIRNKILPSAAIRPWSG